MRSHQAGQPYYGSRLRYQAGPFMPPKFVTWSGQHSCRRGNCRCDGSLYAAAGFNDTNVAHFTELLSEISRAEPYPEAV